LDHGAISTADFLAGEDAGEQGADDAADTMHAERVERVVISKAVFNEVAAKKQTTPATMPMITAGLGRQNLMPV